MCMKEISFIRIFDLVLAICILVVVSPLMLFVAYKVYKEESGSIIYDGYRMGRYGKNFKCYKFRSMYDDEEILDKYFVEHPEEVDKWDKFHKLDDDPRVTKFGKFLRRSSIDEFPQLINIIKGEMSLVGPRPYLPQEKDAMGEYCEIILSIKPGLTGYWQVEGRNNISFQERLAMESWYVQNRSFGLDIKLLFKTIGVVFSRVGAK